MKRIHWLTWLSLGLWLFTIGYSGYYFIFGTTTKNTVDKRVAVVLSSSDREFILDEMRGLLKGLRDIMEGLSKDNMKDISKALSNMGMKAAAHESHTLHRRLPIGFKMMGMGLRKKMDKLSTQLSQKKINRKQLLTELTTSMNTCVSCHSTYKIVTTYNSDKNPQRTKK
ncbi:MAG: hypothetical protein CL932_13805 [Deltaproteobacteria bacterium]|nr:hypothetical protein [Deltaproteobacteria bacterium]|tara:strand:+ start:20850 stop:21356 length:507 start_codon:yes stop_codon:yes gene_type:complete